MDGRMKITRDFKSVKGIDRVISAWVRDSGFAECESPVKMNSDDAAYCFHAEDGDSKVFLTINALDDMVRIEIWVMADLGGKQLPKSKIDNLLELLGQDPL